MIIMMWSVILYAIKGYDESYDMFLNLRYNLVPRATTMAELSLMSHKLTDKFFSDRDDLAVNLQEFEQAWNVYEEREKSFVYGDSEPDLSTIRDKVHKIEKFLSDKIASKEEWNVAEKNKLNSLVDSFILDTDIFEKEAWQKVDEYENETDRLYRLRLRLLLMLGTVTLLLSIFIVIYTTKTITKPIYKLRDSTFEISRGNFDIDLDVTAKGAIGDLAESFRKMTFDLKTSNAKLEKYSHSLEHIVDERTRDLQQKMLELKNYNEAMLSVLEDSDEAKKKLEITLNELRSTQEQLIQAGKLSGIGQMAAGVAHEINNPLTSILGYSQLMMSDKSLDSKIKEDLVNIEKEAKRCVTIIENLLSFARPMPPQKEHFNINNILEATLKVVSYSITREQMNIVKEFGDHLPKIFGDAYQLQQVFLNLIINAVHAMKSGGTLTLETGLLKKGGNEFVCVSVKDTGVGIPDNIKDKVFEPFFTTSYQSGRKGTGLGLSISHTIIREHNGMIEFESKEGVGSAFRVILPVA